ncbi:glutamine--fructose-6-phosphate transaminase (isomerizing) [Desulfurococcus amylolyticus]|uniref:glutamine--fructose-6-phosphate transaminase (isomerizing) n=1 Tax=Desulfurococcus amylolyticus TaxID=94694 RepID=UPI0005B1F970|nr:glutamine--fructose-6-phosphate transaminase (isomerizing) [Desulfurococcus amylolyticus]
MGGIFGVICSTTIPRGLIVTGLRRLLYRGYNGTGVVFPVDKGLEIRKAPGHLDDVVKQVDLENIPSRIALAHTRYASRGWPVYENTHPLTDCNGGIAVVGDGIIDNYEAYRTELEKEGHILRSRTDTEIAAHLLEKYYTMEKDLLRALLRIGSELKGLYSLAFLVSGVDGILFIQNGQPLVIGIGSQCVYLSSDLTSLHGLADTAYIIEDGMAGLISLEKQVLYRISTGEHVDLASLQSKRVKYGIEYVEKAGFPHYMLKEIYETPDAIYRTTIAIMDKYLRLASMIIHGARDVYIVANGSSLHAGLVASYYFAELAGISITPVSAAEFPYSILESITTGSVLIAVSQSGETSDVINSVKLAKQRGAVIIGVTNNVGSRLALESNVYLPIGAGPEIAVPATKSFSSTIAALLLLASYTGIFNGRQSFNDYNTIINEIRNTSKELKELITRFDSRITSIVNSLPLFYNVYVAGSGITYPIALEGALKLKEAALIHAEGVQLGELRHGPLTLVSHEFPVILIEPFEEPAKQLYLKVVKEVLNREAILFSININDAPCKNICVEVPGKKYLYPVIATIPLQLFSYRIGVKLGRPIDHPPGLAKAITT